MSFDTFTRADGAIGNAESGEAWIPQSGTWSVSGQKAVCAEGDQRSCVINTGFAACDVSADIDYPVGGDAGLVFGVTDNDSYLVLTAFGGNNLNLYKRPPAGFAFVTGAAMAFSPGLHTMRAIFNATTGDIQAYFDGDLKWTFALSAPDLAVYQLGTKQGIRQHTTGITFDNFSSLLNETLVPYGAAGELDAALAFEVETAKVYEGFEVARGSMGYGTNRKKKKFATGEGRSR